MPILFGTVVYSATYNSNSLEIACSGLAFGEEIDPISNIEVSVHGLNSWVGVVPPPTFWSDTLVKGNTVSILSSGVYDVRVTSSDGEAAYLSGAFSFAGTGTPAFKIDIANNWSYINETYILVGGQWIKPTTTFSLNQGQWKYHY